MLFNINYYVRREIKTKGGTTMDILFKRAQSQSQLTGRVKFKLHAKIELSHEERQLVNKYEFDRSMLIQVDQPGLMRRAIIFGILAFVAIFVFFFFGIQYQLEIYIHVPIMLNLILSVFGAILIGFFAHTQMRETIYVKDLIHGRYFKCPSVIELARKEAHLQNICGYLRQVLESAKHWDGEEKFEILPLPKEEAKRMILSGPVL